MADESREEEKRKKKEAKEQIKTLKQQKKDSQKEINRIKEESGQSHMSLGLVLTIVILFLLILLALIKLDVGGFGSSVLGPLIGDVPYVQKILPASAQSEPIIGNSSGDASAEASADTASAASANAVSEDADSESASSKKSSKKKSSSDDEDSTDSTDSSDSSSSGSSSGGSSASASGNALDPTMQMYVDTYTAMDASTAASILQGMEGDYDLVAEILSNCDTTTRANILAAMKTQNAAKISKIMSSK